MDTLDSVGLGTMGISDPESITLAIEAGYRHLDTAQVYDNESVVGEGIRWAEIDREDVFVATKVWIDQLGYDSVVQSVTDSLERLGMDSVDLLYVHRPRGEYDPEGTLEGFEELVDRGSVHHIRVSNFEVPQLKEARQHLQAPIFANQVEYHPLFQPTDALADAQANDYTLVAYSPLANGRAGDISEVVDIARTHDTTPEAVCIAWLTAKDNVVVIPKASSKAHLMANRDAAELQLSTNERTRIDDIERETELFPE
ncbi:aldo/keto reductase [Halococcus sp. IIIV-5B]|uniref:aldo/keto reductase n=1 Tax=Halococcus sp. IIIV-5B TaxID=2321230 RepID=UPI0018F608EB|nr:aldo/keto reductase [Halococcus sp. IIIV-5B]